MIGNNIRNEHLPFIKAICSLIVTGLSFCVFKLFGFYMLILNLFLGLISLYLAVSSIKTLYVDEFFFIIRKS
jgi:hypothetical protein